MYLLTPNSGLLLLFLFGTCSAVCRARTVAFSWVNTAREAAEEDMAVSGGGEGGVGGEGGEGGDGEGGGGDGGEGGGGE